MQNQRQPWGLLFLALLSLLTLSYILLTFPPSASFALLSLHISYIFPFFILLFLFVYAVSAFFFRSGLQGMLMALTVCLYFLFRFTGLTQPLFPILLFILFFCIEAIIWKIK